MTPQVFKNKLNSVLKDNATERFSFNKKKGKLNNKRLYKIDLSQKIFKVKDERKGKDYSITFLLDNSGSMCGDLDTVMESTDKIAKVLDKLKIDFSVYCFGSVVRLIKDFNEKYTENVSKLYDEAYHIDVYYCLHCKIYDNEENCIKCGKKCNSSSNRSTADAVALHTICNRVTKRSKKNIVIILTDGEGDTISYNEYYINNLKIKSLHNVKTVINKFKKQNDDLIILCVGINLSSAREVYGRNNTEIIDDADEAYDAFIKLLQKTIKRV